MTPRFARVREEFERNFAERGEVGASVCVTVDGETVVDLWGGTADPAAGRRLGAGHDRPRLVGDQGRDRAVRAHARRPRSARPERAGADVLAGVRQERQGRRSWSGTCSTTRPGCRRVREPLPAGCFYDWDADGGRAGPRGAVLAPGYPARLPRADVRLPGRRGRPAGQRAHARRVLPRRGRRAAGPGLLARAARGARAPGRADHPGRPARAGRPGAEPLRGRAAPTRRRSRG